MPENAPPTTDGFNGTVKRCHAHDDTGGTSWIEPPLDSRWPDLDKLRWWAAAVSYDTELKVSVRDRTGSPRGSYSVAIDGASVAMTGDFGRTWDHLTGILRGAQAARARSHPEYISGIPLREALTSMVTGWQESAKRRRDLAENHGAFETRANHAAAAVYEMVATQVEAIIRD